MPRPLSPLNLFPRQVLLRVLNDDSTIVPAPSGLTVVGSIVAAADEDAAADAALADPTWTVNGTYIGTYTDPATSKVYGEYQFKISGSLITVAKCDAAFVGALKPFFVVHLDGSVHKVEELIYRRGSKATLA